MKSIAILSILFCLCLTTIRGDFVGDMINAFPALGQIGQYEVSWTTNGDSCTFHGIICDTGKNIVGLHLYALDLSQNSLPSSISELTNLKNLVINGCKLKSLPDELFGLKNIQYLRIIGNDISDIKYVENSVNSFKNLIILEFSSNNIKGSLPDLSGLQDLKYIYMEDNKLSGKIPNLPAGLIELVLSDNSFDDDLSKFSGLTNLEMLHLSNNKFSGALDVLSSLTNLRSIRLDYNQFTGKLPDFSGHTNLFVLNVRSNQLEGTISGENIHPKILYLGKNKFSGSLPKLVSTRFMIDYLDLSENSLTIDCSSQDWKKNPPIKCYIGGGNTLQSEDKCSTCVNNVFDENPPPEVKPPPIDGGNDNNNNNNNSSDNPSGGNTNGNGISDSGLLSFIKTTATILGLSILSYNCLANLIDV